MEATHRKAPARAQRRAASVARLAVVALVVAAAAPLVGACGTDAVGVEECRRVETVRCQRAPACSIDLSRFGAPADQVDGCVRFYRDACLHGLVTPVIPATTQVDACVQSLATVDCSYVLAPATHPACAWLIPPTDAAADAPSSSDSPFE